MFDASNPVLLEDYAFDCADKRGFALPVSSDCSDHLNSSVELEEVSGHIPHVEVEPADAVLVHNVEDSNILNENWGNNGLERHVE